MILKGKIIDVNVRNNIECVSEWIVKQMLYKNQIYRRFVKKNLGLLNILIEKRYLFIEKNMDF